MQQLLLPLTPPPAANFDNFITGDNAATLAALKLFLFDSTSPNRGRSFVLWGGVGVGKSHLLHAAATALLSSINSPDESAEWPSEGLILLDTNTLSEQLANRIFLHFNEYPDSRFVISLHQALPALTLREDLKTRLLMGNHYPLMPLREEAVMAAIDTETLRRGFLLSKEVVSYLFRHWQRDIRSLLAVIDGLDEMSLEKQSHITVPLLKKWLEQKSTSVQTLPAV
ncbi:MAG: hypothetical protein RLZZ502_561 [Pseudomonadota bacterium]|jgi:DnaA family protein